MGAVNLFSWLRFGHEETNAFLQRSFKTLIHRDDSQDGQGDRKMCIDSFTESQRQYETRYKIFDAILAMFLSRFIRVSGNFRDFFRGVAYGLLYILYCFQNRQLHVIIFPPKTENFM